MNIEERETWKPVKDYEGYYEINKNGLVRSAHKITKGYIMEQRIDRGGYYTVRLNKPDMLSSTKYIHRLLALAFIENDSNKPFVNHIDGNKLNNQLENLEWVTHAENMKHAYNIGLVGIVGKCKQIIDECSGQLFSSIKKAAEYYNIPYSSCKNYLNGNRPNPTCLRYLSRMAA